MKKKIGIAILAHGEKHILESLDLLKSIKEKTNYEFNYYVATNDVNKFQHLNVNIIEIQGEFNYNLKMIPIEESMKYNDITISIDSDSIMIEDIDFNNLLNIEEGLYVMKYLDYPKVYPYYSVLQSNSGIAHIQHFFEHFFIIKLTSVEKKKKFFDNWRRLFEIMKPFQLYSKGEIGASVGLIISSSAEISDIKIFDYVGTETQFFFFTFNHLFNDN